MTSDWRIQVHKILDDAERGIPAKKITMSGAARSAGVNRISLWRDQEIRQRFEKLSLPENSGATQKPSRRSADQRVRALTLQVAKLEADNNRLLQTFIVICRRLNEKGIDPTTVLGRVTPSHLNSAWTENILKWNDQ